LVPLDPDHKYVCLEPGAVNVSVMSMLGWYWAPNPKDSITKPGAGQDKPGDDLIETAAAAEPSADCCIARAKYHVVLPAKASMPHGGDLMLCSHHYRNCASGLHRSGAAIYTIDGRLVAGPT